MASVEPLQAWIGLVSVIVHDYDEAISFFTSKLGFTLAEDSPATSSVTGDAKRWVVVRPPGSTKGGLLLAQAAGDEQKAAVGKQWAGRVGLFLNVDNFQQQYQMMKQAGVEFFGEPREEAYGQVVVFADVAGNKWDLIGPNSGTRS